MKEVLLAFLFCFPDTSQKSVTTAVLLSCFLPGGGQFYNEKYVKGIFFGGVEIFTGYMAFRNYLDYRRTNSERRFEESFSYSFYFLGMWLYSIADAYVDAQLYNFEKKMHVTAGPGGIGVSISFP